MIKRITWKMETFYLILSPKVSLLSVEIAFHNAFNDLRIFYA